MIPNIPSHGLQLTSTLQADGTLELELMEVPVARPGPDDVVLRVEGAPINPADMMAFFPCADPAEARFEGTRERPKVIARLSPEATQARAGRIGQRLRLGNEGAGTVIAAGENVQRLIGMKMAVRAYGKGIYSQFCTLPSAACTALPEGATSAEGAALFTNPLTALAMIECTRIEGHKALIQTAAASNLGQMLVKICAEDGMPLVNVVRRQEQVDLLRNLGAVHVCNSSAHSFQGDLVQAIAATGATIAFDALGGGGMADHLLAAMESAAVSRMSHYSPYGSSEFKKVYILGCLDTTPTELNHTNYGMLWGVDGFVMPAILKRVSAERNAALMQRVLDGIRTTFASSYAREISLAEALQRDVMLDYYRKSTGNKYLINPTF